MEISAESPVVRLIERERGGVAEAWCVFRMRFKASVTAANSRSFSSTVARLFSISRSNDARAFLQLADSRRKTAQIFECQSPK